MREQSFYGPLPSPVFPNPLLRILAFLLDPENSVDSHYVDLSDQGHSFPFVDDGAPPLPP